MPSKTDKIAINDPFLNRRVKLLPCQREMVHYWHERGASINSIARMFQVHKSTIQFILFPERLKRNIQLRADRGGWKQYYDREQHRIITQDHRQYKRNTLPNEQ